MAVKSAFYTTIEAAPVRSAPGLELSGAGRVEGSRRRSGRAAVRDAGPEVVPLGGSAAARLGLPSLTRERLLDAYDNAVSESGWATLTNELLVRRSFATATRRGRRSSPTSRASTTPAGAIQGSATSHRPSPSGGRPWTLPLRRDPRWRWRGAASPSSAVGCRAASTTSRASGGHRSATSALLWARSPPDGHDLSAQALPTLPSPAAPDTRLVPDRGLVRPPYQWL